MAIEGEISAAQWAAKLGKEFTLKSVQKPKMLRNNRFIA